MMRVRRSALFSGTVVALSIGMLTLAGTTPREIGRPVGDPSRVQLDSRTFSCTGGIAGTRVRSGSVRAGLAAERRLGSGAEPVDVVADRNVAGGAFAGQQATSGASLAWLPCPEPAARWWFVGAGGAENTHDTVLTITNPRAGEASVDIVVYGPKGPVQAPDFRNIAIGARGTKVIDLAKTAPAIGNLAVSITATRGLVAVSAADRFAPGSLGAFAREWLPAQSLPSTSVTLAGIPVERGSSSLMVANPGEVDAIVKVEVIGQTGTFVPEALREFIVGPGQVRTVPMASVIDGTPLALKVSSEQKVTAAVRSVKSGDTAFSTGVEPIRGGTALAVPDGKARLMLSSVRDASSVQVASFAADGTVLKEVTVPVAAATTSQVVLPAGTRYVRLLAEDPTVVGGLVVVGTRGTATAGIGSSVRSVVLPKVTAGW
ncbi:MAG: DUF5719 family protein [Propionibacteriales bacterium]|nr:DUF5719 family protein [Propionibacteriales bacterium]